MKNLIFATAGAVILGCYAAKLLAAGNNKQRLQYQPNPTAVNPRAGATQGAAPVPPASSGAATDQPS